MHNEVYTQSKLKTNNPQKESAIMITPPLSPASTVCCQVCGQPLHVHISTDVNGNPLPPCAECKTVDCVLKDVTLLLTAFPLDADHLAAYMQASARIEARLAAARARWALEDEAQVAS